MSVRDVYLPKAQKMIVQGKSRVFGSNRLEVFLGKPTFNPTIVMSHAKVSPY